MVDKVKYLYDDFSTFDTSKWWRSNPAQGIVSSGQLQLIPSTGYYYVSTVDDWDATDSYIAFKLVQNANEGLGSVGTSFTLGPDWDNNVEFEIEGGGAGAIITCQELVDGVASTTTFAYNPAVHVWFRIRESIGTVYWETSTDGVSWALHRELETSVDLTESDVRFSAYHWDAETDPGVTIIDDFNLPTGIPGRPKAHTLVDPFDIADAQWIWGDVENQVIGGQLHMVSSEENYSPLYSTNTYDLTESHFGIELIQNNPKGNGTYLNDISVGPDLDNCVYIRFAENTGWVQFAEKVEGVVNTGGSIQLDPARHKWFRIRESGGTVYWDTSIDGSYWTNRRSKTTTLDLTASKIRIYCAPYGEEEIATVIWDNVNNFTETGIGPDVPFKADLFQDTFDDDSSWYGSEGVVFQNGAIYVDVVEEYQYATCNDFWDMRDSYMFWEMVQNALQGTSGWDGSGTTGTNLIVTVGDSEDDNSVRFIIYGGDNGVVQCEERHDGVRTFDSFTYNKLQDRYFRIRVTGDTTYWETSPNSLTWTVRRTSDTGFDYYSCKFGFSIGYWDTEGEFGPNGTVILDNFNVVNTAMQAAIGWIRSDACSLGGRKTGTVEARNYFELADWHWEPIPENPVLDDFSEEIGYWLHRPDITPTPKHGAAIIRYANAFVHPNQITPDTPRYYVHLDWVEVYYEYESFPGDLKEEDPFAEYQGNIPIPYGTQVPPGSDAHLTIADPYTNKVYSFWQCRYDPVNDTWKAAYGGIADLHGDGREYAGSSTATNISRYACIPRLGEMQAGEIPHALFAATNISTSTFRYPAQKSDGVNHAGAEYPIEQGSRMQLDPSIDLTAIPNISPAELAVGRAWQKYGCYIGDQGGNAWPPTVGSGGGGELYQGQEWPQYPFPDPRSDWDWPDGDPFPDLEVPQVYKSLGLQWDYYAFTKIPWAGNIRVLKHWHGGNTL